MKRLIEVFFILGGRNTRRANWCEMESVKGEQVMAHQPA